MTTAGSNGGSAVAEPHVGRPLRRKEDPRLISGRARYVDDISMPGMLWAAFVRCPERT
jgi:aerobic carbon-monoxide dehydrogenase large subunit